MKKIFTLMLLFMCGVAVLICTNGCSAPRVTETGRTAVEQFLLSNVVELGIGSADFKEYAGKKIFIEYDYLAPQVDKPYVQGVLEKHLAQNGVIVSRDAKDSELLIQIISGVLATDMSKFTIGTPSLPIPIPDTSISLAIPEISLFQKMTRYGFGKFSFNILESATRKPVRVIDGIEARTSYTNWVILLLPFRSHDMKMDIKNGKDTQFEFDWD